jgi:hypothetical protein
MQPLAFVVRFGSPTRSRWSAPEEICFALKQVWHSGYTSRGKQLGTTEIEAWEFRNHLRWAVRGA